MEVRATSWQGRRWLLYLQGASVKLAASFVFALCARIAPALAHVPLDRLAAPGRSTGLCPLPESRGETHMSAYPNQPASDHREAIRLSRESLHIPVGTMFLATLLLGGVFSPVSMMWGY